MFHNERKLTANHNSFHIPLTGNCVLKPSLVLSFLEKIRYQIKLTKTTGLVHEPVT